MKVGLLIGRVVLGLFALPWVIVVGLVRFVWACVCFPARVAAKASEKLMCPAGHPNALQGRWTCSCGATYLGHAFAPCPICGIPAGFLRCDRCGLAIRSPWKGD